MRIGVHWLFLVLLAVAIGAGYFAETMILVGSLTAHEIAHLAVAWVLGLQVEEVIITPFGGMARLDTLVETDPQAETSVALAGPFQSFFLAGLMLFLTGDQLFDQRLVKFCFDVNANLAFFNLIPALPLDGGRALRGLMAQRWGYRRVTGWMALLGRFCGVGMAGAALLVWLRTEAHTLFLTPLVGGMFVAFGAGQEVETATYRSYRQFLRKREQLKESRVLAARQLAAVEGTRLGEVMEHLVQRRYHMVLVVDRNLQPLGTLYEAELMEAFQELGPEATVEQILDV
ncbi:MAG TPA: M50 family metallopeptidase [Symbiobacteriaceae bacterium]|nr:M50 family metallopeptidase [Symbiobacteriaceae bacterium]